MSSFKHVLGVIETHLATFHQFGVQRVSLFDESFFAPDHPRSLSLLVKFDDKTKIIENAAALQAYLEHLFSNTSDLTVTVSSKAPFRDHVLLRIKQENY